MIDLQKLFDGCMRFAESKVPTSWPPVLRSIAVQGVETVRVLVDTAGLPELEAFLRKEGVLTE